MVIVGQGKDESGDGGLVYALLLTPENENFYTINEHGIIEE